jgi:hypothetical protein
MDSTLGNVKNSLEGIDTNTADLDVLANIKDNIDAIITNLSTLVGDPAAHGTLLNLLYDIWHELD